MEKGRKQIHLENRIQPERDSGPEGQKQGVNRVTGGMAGTKKPSGINKVAWINAVNSPASGQKINSKRQKYY